MFIIALSRKMPRFFDWVKKAVEAQKITSATVKRLCELLESDVEITTEYAIPLLFRGYSKTSSKKIAGIIADDVIIFGATLQRVSMQWWAFSGEIPHVLALFRGTRGVLDPKLESEGTLKLPRMSTEVLESALDTISRKIHSTSLPIDVEYPLIYSNISYEEVKNYIQENCPLDWQRYDVKSESYVDSVESFSVIIGNGRNDGLTNDHAKIRLFKKPSGCCIEMIAPSHINIANLKNRFLFSSKSTEHNNNTLYANLWQHIYNTLNIEKGEDSSIVETIEELLVNKAILSTLVIWAEYLYCIAAFVKNQTKFFPKGTHNYIEKTDIALLLGNNIASGVLEDLNTIINEGQTISTSFDNVSLQEYVNPKNLTDDYMLKVMGTLKDNVRVSDNLDALFRVSHFTSDICKIKSNKNTSGHHSIGESFESIMQKIEQFHPDCNDLLEEVHRWIDVRIDEGRIAPKYEIVVGSDGRRYFRRFFLCGSNKI